MKKLLFFVVLLICSPRFAQSQGTAFGQNSEKGKYAKINGINIYYEIYGEGPPLLVIHGNGGSIGGYSNLMPELIKHYKVVAVDSRCHGKSGCTAEELTYEQMASDMYELLNQLKLDSLLVWGHSDGGIIGLIMAYKYPGKVRKLVSTGANLVPDATALQPELVQMMKMYPMIPDSIERKHIKLMVDHPHILIDSLRKIKAPVLVMSGDRDAIRLEHTVAIFQAIPNSNLCILPATTHFIGRERPELFLHFLTEFFDRPFSNPSMVKIAQEQAKQMMQQKKN